MKIRTGSWLDEYEANRKYDPDVGRIKLPLEHGDYQILEGLTANPMR